MIGHAIDNALTRGNKAEIAHWCMPDYTAGVSLSYTDLNSGFTATYDGVLLCCFQLNGKVDINENQFTCTLNSSNTPLRTILLKKGDTIKTTTLNTNYAGTNIFFPLIAG